MSANKLGAALLKQFALGLIEKDISEIAQASGLDGFDQPIWIRQLSSQQVEDYQFKMLDLVTGKGDVAKCRGVKAELIFMCVCDETGAEAFESADQVDAFMPNLFVDEVAELCVKINHIEPRKKSDESIEKN